MPFAGKCRCQSLYEGLSLDAGYRLDLLVDDALIVEIKSVEALTSLHEAQVLTYLKAVKTSAWRS